jgi:hypothetical protein
MTRCDHHRTVNRKKVSLAERRGLTLVVATHDEEALLAARALGFECAGA